MAIELSFEHALFIGDALITFLYGIQFYMFVQSTYLFLSRPRGRRPIVRNLYIAGGAVLLIAMSLVVVSTLLIGDLMWIKHRDVPGGPFTYYSNHLSSRFETLASAASSFANLSGDGLLIYRSYMIWGSSLWILVLLLPLYLTNIAMSILSVAKGAMPRVGILEGLPASFLDIWTAIAVAVNISVTVLISARLLVMRRQARAMMNSQSARIYTSVIAIFVESALPYSIVGTLSLITLAVNSSVAPVFSRLLSAFCCLSPQLIILRISMGLGWDRNTEHELTITGPPVFAHRKARSVQLRSTLDPGLETHPEVVEDSGIDCESDSVLREKESREGLTV